VSALYQLDAGVPLRDVQEAVSHADPRTTMRYDRARVSLDRHATYIVAAFIAGAARWRTVPFFRLRRAGMSGGRTPETTKAAGALLPRVFGG
jgi:hypothetical protein